MTGLPPGLDLELSVPPTWFVVDVDPATRGSSLDALLEEQVRDVPHLRPHRTAVARLLRSSAEDAWAAGAVLCAAMVEPVSDDAADGVLTASAVALVVPGPVGVADDERLAALSAPLVPVTRDDAAPEALWREVGVTEVPGAGTAVRSAGVEDVELPEGAGTVRMVVLRTLVPLPAAKVLALTCSSPAVDLADDLLDLFDAVSGSLRVLDAAVPA